MGTEQKNLDVPLKVTGKTVYGIDVRLPGMKWAAVKACPVYGGDVKRYDFDAIRTHAGRALRRAVPDSRSGADARPHLQRRRRRHRRHLVSGQDRARSDADRVEDSARARRVQHGEHARGAAGGARSARHACASIRAMSTRPSRAPTRIVEATYSTPYLPRARMEPGNATVLVTNDRVDIWIGDQSPQETRFSAAKITGIPEQNVHLHLCHLGGGFGRNGNGPQAEHAIMIANAQPRHADPHAVDARGGFHRHDLSRDGRGATQGRLSTPTAGRSRSRCARPCRKAGSVPRRRST